jgi:hypothetical protein
MKKIAFIDESGIGDLTDYKYKNFVLTSVVVDEKELDTIYVYFSLIKRKYNLQEDLPFHTYELLEKHSTRLPNNQSKMFINSMCEFIELVPMTITAVHTNKENFRKKFRVDATDLKGSKINKERRSAVYYLSSLKQMQKFTSLLAKTNSVGYIHADSRTYQDRDLLEAFVNIKQQIDRGGNTNKYYTEAKKRLVSITFADKSALSSGIQLADFISFIVFAHLERKMNTYVEIDLNKVWQKLKGKITIIGLDDSYSSSYIQKYIKG